MTVALVTRTKVLLKTINPGCATTTDLLSAENALQTS